MKAAMRGRRQDPDSGNQDKRTQKVTKIKDQYEIFFSTRFYYVRVF
jgi:hypothetical protein